MTTRKDCGPGSPVAQQREQIEQLGVSIRELEARLAKDSHNSSKPPSSDGLKRKTKSLRAKSGKKAGGQIGHRGETLHLVAAPDEVVEHRPRHCPQCQTSARPRSLTPTSCCASDGKSTNCRPECGCRSRSTRRCTCSVRGART